MSRAVSSYEPAGRTFTRDEVSTAVNAGVQLALDDNELSLSDRDYDLVNLIVNAALSMLDDPPPASLDEVIERNYQPDPECATCGGPLIYDYAMEAQGHEGTYRHAYENNEHEPVPEKVTDVVRGWVNQ